MSPTLFTLPILVGVLAVVAVMGLASADISNPHDYKNLRFHQCCLHSPVLQHMLKKYPVGPTALETLCVYGQQKTAKPVSLPKGLDFAGGFAQLLKMNISAAPAGGGGAPGGRAARNVEVLPQGGVLVPPAMPQIDLDTAVIMNTMVKCQTNKKDLRAKCCPNLPAKCGDICNGASFFHVNDWLGKIQRGECKSSVPEYLQGLGNSFEKMQQCFYENAYLGLEVNAPAVDKPDEKEDSTREDLDKTTESKKDLTRENKKDITREDMDETRENKKDITRENLDKTRENKKDITRENLDETREQENAGKKDTRFEWPGEKTREDDDLTLEGRSRERKRKEDRTREAKKDLTREFGDRTREAKEDRTREFEDQTREREEKTREFEEKTREAKEEDSEEEC